MSRIVIVGEDGGTHLGGSFRRAAEALGIAHEFVSRGSVSTWSPSLRRILWHLGDRRLPRGAFGESLHKALASRPALVFFVGAAPLRARDLRACRAAGARTAIFLTDDHANRSASGRRVRSDDGKMCGARSIPAARSARETVDGTPR